MYELEDAFCRSSNLTGREYHLSHGLGQFYVGVLPVPGVLSYGDLPHLGLVHPEPQLGQAARNL